MSKSAWVKKQQSVASLHLDVKNPRLGRESTARAPREIIQYLFDHDKAFEVAESITRRGFFHNEPLLVIKEEDKLVVVEGNRRLAALKALKEPGLLEGSYQAKLERLVRLIHDPSDIRNVPIVIAPSRRATDKLIAGRHVGTPVLAWESGDRASFILDKLTEGYTDIKLQDELGFSTADIQAARQTRAIADMARAIDLPDEVKAKLDNPRTKLFSTLERIFDSTVGREFLMVEPNAEYGVRGKTTKKAFLPGFKKLVTDILLGDQSSRSLNKNDDIRSYFEGLSPEFRVKKRQGSFVPADITKGKKLSKSNPKPAAQPKPKPSKPISQTVIPRSFQVRYGNDRLKDIRRELVAMRRDKFPNAGAVMLRIFLELSILDYLSRTGELKPLIKEIEKKEKRKLPFGAPGLSHLVKKMTKIAKDKLTTAEANKVARALSPDKSAPFTVKQLHGFVHQDDLPSERDILQFWSRMEPLFSLMLERDHEGPDA